MTKGETGRLLTLRCIGAEVVGLVGSSPETGRRKGTEIDVPAYDSDVPEGDG